MGHRLLIVVWQIIQSEKYRIVEKNIIGAFQQGIQYNTVISV